MPWASANFAATGRGKWLPGWEAVVVPAPPDQPPSPPGIGEVVDWPTVGAWVSANFTATGRWEWPLGWEHITGTGIEPHRASVPVDLAEVAVGEGGFMVVGTRVNAGGREDTGDHAGAAVAAIGDLNGDGLPELVVGVPDGISTPWGGAYVVLGKHDGLTVHLSDVVAGEGGFRLIGETSILGNAGREVSAIDDLNGDGRDEVLVGAPGGSVFGVAPASPPGAAYVVWGKEDGTPVDLADIAASHGGFRMTGEAREDSAGAALAPVGALNGDGLPELIVGAPGNDAGGEDAGAAYVVWGKADEVPVDLAEIATGSGGFRILGEAGDGAAGSAVGAIGDLNGDGLPEVLVGAPGENDVYVVWGKTDGATVRLPDVAAGHGLASGSWRRPRAATISAAPST